MPNRILRFFSDRSGLFEQKLPPGTYFIAAVTSLDGREYFSYYGGNPLYLRANDSLKMALRLVPSLDPPKEAFLGENTLFGVVFHKGAPLAGASIDIYENGESFFRGPGYAEAKTSNDGAFSLELSEGSYFILVRKRLDSKVLGPLKPGDYFGFYPQNPIVIGDNPKIVALNTIRKPKEGAKGLANTVAGTYKMGQDTLSGTVLDKDNRPVSGIYVNLYNDKDMIKKPAYMFGPTAPDGRFYFYLESAGSFYLGARSGYGGPPKQGEWFGRYNKNIRHLIDLDPKDPLSDVKIIIYRLLQ